MTKSNKLVEQVRQLDPQELQQQVGATSIPQSEMNTVKTDFENYLSQQGDQFDTLQDAWSSWSQGQNIPS